MDNGFDEADERMTSSMEKVREATKQLGRGESLLTPDMASSEGMEQRPESPAAASAPQSRYVSLHACSGAPCLNACTAACNFWTAANAQTMRCSCRAIEALCQSCQGICFLPGGLHEGDASVLGSCGAQYVSRCDDVAPA